VAELEAGLISERTNCGLGGRKGSGSEARQSKSWAGAQGQQVGNKQAVAAGQANAEHRAENLRSIVEELRAGGFTIVRAIAAELNSRGILPPPEVPNGTLPLRQAARTA
jgi:hypothetical protein